MKKCAIYLETKKQNRREVVDFFIGVVLGVVLFLLCD